MELKEMLELAALAAGYKGTVTEYANGYAEMGLSNHFSPSGSNVWAPNTNDGYSFRLAVALNMIVGVYERFTSACQNITPNDIEVDVLGEVVVWHHETNNDPLKATRMAVLRCAAEIGKSMLENSK